MKRISLFTALVALLALMLAACGPAATAPTATLPPPTATPLPPTATPVPATATAQPVTATQGDLAAALEKSKELKKYRVTLDITGKGALGQAIPNASPDQEVALIQMSGEFDNNNSRFVLKGFLATFLGADQAKGIEFISFDGQSYVRGPIQLLGATEDKWYVVPQEQSSVTRPPLEANQVFDALSGSEGDFSGFTPSGTEQLDGSTCTVYTADKEATTKAIEGLGATQLGAGEANIEAAEMKFWACEDGYIRQIQATFSGSEKSEPDQKVNLAMLMRISDINGNFTVTAPQDAVPLQMPALTVPTTTP